ncbi:VCBS domain-containing protein [Leptolyngbya ohadii]|uniref:VCBS domain-containing protein n=1 Tax=Leptolyngbya ohadii TaxID=1962290 RepID=UPI000B59B0FE|nr:VCBS domain-containing protein [Leptolyngbya ohadii]
MEATPGTPFVVNQTTARSQSTYPSSPGGIANSVSIELTRPMRSIAMDANGDFVVVWSSLGQDNGLTWGVYGRRYDKDGNPKGPEFLINTEVRQNQTAPSVAIDAAGNFIVTWSSNFLDLANDASEYGVYARRYDSSGTAIDATEFLVNKTTGFSQVSSVVAMDQDDDLTDPTDGGFVITWTDQNNDGDGFGVYAQLYDKNGAVVPRNVGGVPTTDDIPVTSTGTSAAQTAGNQMNSSVAMADDGSFVVIWESDQGEVGAGSSDFGIFAQRFDAQGQALGDRIQINSFAAGPQRRPSIAMASDGSFVVAWSSQGQISAGGWDVFYRRFDRNGVALTPERQANFDATGSQQDVTVSMSPNGNFIISWTSTAGILPDGVYARRFNASGNSLAGTNGDEFRLDGVGGLGVGKYASIATTNGNFAAVWTGDDNPDPSIVNEGVIGRTYSVEVPTGNTPPTNIILTPGGTEASVAENDTGAVLGELSADDAEGNNITFTVSGDPRFEVIGNQLKLRAGESLNFENPADKTITLTITATDDGTPANAATQTITVSATDVNEAPFNITLDNLLLNENTPAGTLVGRLGAEDPENNPIAFTIANNPFYEIVNGTEIVVKAGANLNFENPVSQFFEITVTAADNATPPLTASQTFTIALQDVNEVPGEIELLSNTVAENDFGADIGEVRVVDPDAGDVPLLSVSDSRFEIVGGRLKLKAGQSLNYEDLIATSGLFPIEIIATDPRNAALQSRQTVTLQVTDVNEPPDSISLDSLNVTENTPGATVGQLTFVDPENNPQDLTVVGDPRFEVDPLTNTLKLRAGVQLDREATPTINITIRASDRTTPAVFADRTFTLNVLNQNETPNDITLVNNPISENTLGAIIGAVTATDPDGTTPILSVSDPRFEIDLAGNLKLRDDQSLDFETLAGGKLSLIITATDSEDPLRIFDRTFEITVNNVNEAPVLTAPTSGSVRDNQPGEVIGSIAATDPENDPVTFSVDDTRFEVTAAGVLKLRDGQSLSLIDGPSVTVNVIASDGTLTTSQPIRVDVVPSGTPTNILLDKTTVNEATPRAVVGKVTVEDENDTLHTFTVDDPRFEVVQVGSEYQLQLTDGTLLDFEAQPGNPPPIRIKIRAQDDDGLSVEREFDITITDINEAPTDISLNNLTVDEQLPGAVIGNISVTDPDRVDSFIYTFSDPRFEVRSGQLKLRDGVELDISDGTTLNLTVTARDKGGLEVSETFTLNVDNVNFAPTDIAISKNTIDEDTDGAIVGQLTVVDADRGDTHTFTVDNDARFEVDASGNLRLKAGQQINYETEPVVNLIITATDNGIPAQSVTKSIAVQVNNLNDAPTISFTPAATIDENVPGGVVGTLTITDPEGGTPTLTLGGTLANQFEIVGNQIKLLDTASLDFEALAGGAVNLVVTATDNGTPVRTVTLPIVFPIGDVNEAPTDLNLSNLTVSEQSAGAEVGLVQVTDPDRPAVENFTYTVSDPRFEIVSGRLKLKDTEILSLETTPTITLTVTANDRGGLPISRPFTITVERLNVAPTGVSLDKTTIDEDTLGAVVGRLTVADANRTDTHTFTISDSRFEVDSSGNLKLKADASINFEVEPVINLTVIATDNGGLSSPPQAFTISVVNLNEAPTDLTLANNWVAENAPGAVIGAVAVTDSDSTTFTYTVSDDRFEVVGGQLKLKDGRSLDFEVGATIPIDITVIDSGTPVRQLSRSFVLDVTNVNEAPTTITLANNRVAEDTPGAIVGLLTATDPDTGDTVSFSVTDSRFEIDAANNLKLKSGISLNAEDPTPVQVTVVATDRGGLTQSQIFTIQVTNVNDAPTDIRLSNSSVAENSSGAIIGDVIVTDPDSSAFSFTVSDSTRFEVVGGQLKLKAGQSLDFESGSTITLDITAIDNGTPPQSFTKQFTISVIDGNDAPTEIRLLSDRVAENSPGAIVGLIQVTDGDAGDRFTFRLSDARFEVDAAGNLKLRTGQQLDAEVTPTIPLDITAIDSGGLERTQRFVLTVTNVNEPPTSLTLTGNTIDESASPNAQIGIFSATDTEGGSFSYSLVPGVADNDAFTISGDRLLLKNPVDFETKNLYSIRVAVTDNGGLTLTQTFEIRVTNANEAPIITPATGTLIYAEDAGAIAIDSTLNLTDADSATLSGATVRLLNYVPGQDQLSFTSTPGITGGFDPATGVLTLSGVAALSTYQNLLRSIAYTNSSNAPNLTNRIVQISVSDGVLTSQIASRTIQIVSSNDAPIVTPSVSTVVFTLDNRTVELDGGLDITDVDSSTLSGAMIALEGYVAGEDNLLFNDQSGIVGSFNAVSGTLTLTGTASLDAYRLALRSILYLNSSQQPTAKSRFATITVSDGTVSSPVRVELQYQQTAAPPVVDLNGGGAGSDFSNTFVILGQPVAVISAEAQLTDSDSTALTGAEVTISNLFDAASETLLVDTAGTGIAANYDRPTGTLSLSGTASLNDYITVMQRIRYMNTSAAPDMTTRVILFRVSDGTRSSNAAQTTVQMTDIRLLDGSTGDPPLETTPATDRINAQDGNDIVRSTLSNLQQNDLIDGGTGTDLLTLMDGTGNARIEIANPVNQVSGILINTTTITNFEQFNWSGFRGNMTLVGSSANDAVIAGSGADFLSGDSGNDRLISNAGDDRLDGGTGADYLEGGAGDDFYVVDSAGDQVIELADGGVDTVSASISYTLSDALEDLILTGTALTGTGNALDNMLMGNGLNNTLIGGLGDDMVRGEGGNDVLVGDSGNDDLTGGAGSDRLIGGDGKDRLTGDIGRDRLTGGRGKDQFVLTSTQRSNGDIITDFNAKDDTILISRRSFGRELRRGRVRANQFVLGNRALDANDRFIYSRGSLFYDRDGVGDAKEVLIARLGRNVGITRSDLVVIQ